MGTSLAAPARSTPPPPIKKRNYLASGDPSLVTPTPNPITYNGTSNPKQAATNQRAYVTGEGDALQSQYASQYANQQGGGPVNTVAGTANYLNAVEDPLAQGNGGYNATEASQINLTPQQEQNIASNAGVAAGSVTQAGVGAADRATAAAGGNPLAMAAYRERAADTSGAQAGAATTGGEIAAQQAGSAGAQAVGNARLAQQNQGLQYYQGQNQQANQNAQQANQLQESAYGTEANAGNTATANQIGASQIPTTGDKIVGAIGGGLSSLADGTPAGGKDAVVGENGPEWIGKPRKYMDLGDTNTDDPGDVPSDYGAAPMMTGPNPSPAKIAAGMPGAAQPAWMKFFQAAQNNPSKTPQSNAPATQSSDWQKLGSGLGNVGKLAALAFLDDGAVPANGTPLNKQPYTPFPPATDVPPRSFLEGGKIISKPTKVRLDSDEAVVPLTYRPQAKVRPSMAMRPQGREMYAGAGA